MSLTVGIECEKVTEGSLTLVRKEWIGATQMKVNKSVGTTPCRNSQALLKSLDLKANGNCWVMVKQGATQDQVCVLEKSLYGWGEGWGGEERGKIREKGAII